MWIPETWIQHTYYQIGDWVIVKQRHNDEDMILHKHTDVIANVDKYFAIDPEYNCWRCRMSTPKEMLTTYRILNFQDPIRYRQDEWGDLVPL